MLGRCARGLGVLGVVCGGLLLGVACGTSEGIYDESFDVEGCRGWAVAACDTDADCYIGPVFEPGTRCIASHCLCAVDGQVMCNFRGHPPENNMRGCYFPEQCEPGELCGPEGSGGAGAGASGGAGGGGGVGGAGGEMEEPCETAADCPGPPSWRCGQATCVGGVCGVASIAEPGELVAIDAQIRGDCQTQLCDSTGYLIVVPDGFDIFDDGRRCTIDFCGPGAALNVALEDGSPCPGGSGWCFDGECVECIATIHPPQVCGPGNACQGVYCVPGACGSACGGECAPCPAGYTCSASTDCEDSVCAGGMCALPTCTDTKKNDGETDVDCGMAVCNTPCKDGKGCATGIDCESGVCWAGICQAPTCTDGRLNGKETGVDCGGPCIACGGP